MVVFLAVARVSRTFFCVMSSVIGENETNDGMRHPPSAPKVWRAAEPRHNEITPTKGVP